MVKNKKRIGILRGGDGDDYEFSLRAGGDIIHNINKHLAKKFNVVDILVDQGGVWHAMGLPIKPAELINKVDVVWSVAHPRFSTIVENFSIPVIGADAFSSTISGNRALLEKHMKDNLGISMPRHFILPLFQEDFDGSKEKYVNKKAREIFEKFSPPWIVRFLPEDRTIGVYVVKTMDKLENVIKEGVERKKSILIEELIYGKVAPVHSVVGFRGEDIYTFPIENNFTFAEKEKLSDVTKSLHGHFKNHSYLKSNFILTPRGKIYLTGIIFTPNIKPNSHFSKACESVGAQTHNIVEHILERVLS